MDQSSCEASFSRMQRARFLDAATIDKLERLQQQDEIRRAEVGDLVSCPFCDYAAICPAVDIDRVFECQNTDCMEASCRLCKQMSHIPLSCAEFKKENGIDERHAIEEARTEALVRDCNKCKVRILKDEGCNKIICTNCRSCICDYCGEDISTVRYEHFSNDNRGHPSGKGKCPLFEGLNGKEERIEKAGQAAMDKIRKENPSLSEEDLKIKFAKVVQDQPKARVDPGELNARIDRLLPERRRYFPAALPEGLPRNGRMEEPQMMGVPPFENGQPRGGFAIPPLLLPPAPPAVPMPIVPQVPPAPGYWPYNYGPAQAVPGAAVWPPYYPAMAALPGPALFNAGHLRNGGLTPDQEAWARQAHHQPHHFNYGQFNPAPQHEGLLRPQPPPAAHQPVMQRAQAFNEMGAQLGATNRQVDAQLGATNRQMNAEHRAANRQMDAQLRAIKREISQRRAGPR